jgi:putative membrane protein
MIVRPKLNWLRMLFMWRGSVLPAIMPRLALVLAVSLAAVIWRGQVLDYKISLNPAPFTLMGVALAIFLGFRNGASYDRFWEARKLWGSLLNDSRSLARQAASLTTLPPDDERVRAFVRGLIAFTHVLRHQLRGTDPQADLQRLLPHEAATRVAAATFRSPAVLAELAAWLRARREAGELDPNTLVAMDQNLSQLSAIHGGCERIAGTPLPVAYAVMIHRTVYAYCFLLPFGLVDSLGWMTPVISVLVGYTYMALDALAAELEDPFGTSANDLALDAMSRNIEATLGELIGSRPLPEPPVPETYIVT